MTSFEQRKADIEKYSGERYPDSYYTRLLQVTHGNVDAAARLDAAFDGDTYWADLRKRQFAGIDKLTRLYRESQRAQGALRDAIHQMLWGR
jgi:hypothetical protein